MHRSKEVCIMLDSKSPSHPIYAYGSHLAKQLRVPVVSIVKERETTFLLLEAHKELATLNEWLRTHDSKRVGVLDRPILIAPSQTRWKPVEKMLYLMDMEDRKFENVDSLNQLAEQLDAILHIVLISKKEISEVNESYYVVVDRLRDLLYRKGIVFHRVFGKKSAQEAQELAVAVNADWLVFEQKDTDFLERVFHTNSGKHMILDSHIPVLVI